MQTNTTDRDEKVLLIDVLNQASQRLQKGFDAFRSGRIGSEAWQVLQWEVARQADLAEAAATWMDAIAGTREAWHAPGYRPESIGGWVQQLRDAVRDAQRMVRPSTLEEGTTYMGQPFIDAEVCRV